MGRRMAVAVLVSGCAVAAPRYGPNRAGSLADLRERHGICADADAGRTTVRACAQIGSPGTLRDDARTPILITTLTARDFGSANPGNWQLTIFRPDGTQVVEEILKARVPSVGACDSYGCDKYGIDATAVPGGWTPGMYRLRYVCSFDTSKVAEMTIAVK